MFIYFDRKLYVILAVVICLIASALVLFFLFPRSVTIEQDKIIRHNVTIDRNTSTTVITLWVSVEICMLCVGVKQT